MPDEEIEIIDLDDLTLDDGLDEAAAERMAMLPSFSLFADLPREALLALAERSSLIAPADGADVVRVGAPADALFAIVRGVARVEVPGLEGQDPVLLAEGEIFGEACLLHDEPRHASVKAARGLSALRIPKAVLDELVGAHPQVGEVLVGLLTRRLIVNQLKTNPLFTTLELSMRREVAKLFETRKAESGTVLIEEGKRCDGMYIPLTGKLKLSARGSSKEIAAGSVVGQGSLLGQAPSRYSVTTVGDALLLRLPSSRFMDLITQYPTVLELLTSRSLIAG